MLPLSVAASPSSEPLVLNAVLNGSNEIPPTGSIGVGIATAVLSGNLLTVYGTFENLEGSLINVSGSPVHIHAGPEGKNGPMVFPLNYLDAGDNSGTFRLSAEITDQQAEKFISGGYYMKIRTQGFELGEIRGQFVLNEDSNQAGKTETGSHEGIDEGKDKDNGSMEIKQYSGVNQSEDVKNEEMNNGYGNQAAQAQELEQIPNSVRIFIREWSPESNEIVFGCEASGFLPSGYDWFFGDGEEIRNSSYSTMSHNYGGIGIYMANCTAIAGNNKFSDSIVLINNFNEDLADSNATGCNAAEINASGNKMSFFSWLKTLFNS